MPYKVNVWDDGLEEREDNVWDKIDDNGRDYHGSLI